MSKDNIQELLLSHVQIKTVTDFITLTENYWNSALCTFIQVSVDFDKAVVIISDLENRLLNHTKGTKSSTQVFYKDNIEQISKLYLKVLLKVLKF
jgi:hypothetical protein